MPDPVHEKAPMAVGDGAPVKLKIEKVAAGISDTNAKQWPAS